MNLNIINKLPFTELNISHGEKSIIIYNVLVDSGSMSTIISTDTAFKLGLNPEEDDVIHTVCGVGGTEFVYEKSIDVVKIENATINNMKIQVGAMDYGFEINAIIGMDFLTKTCAVIDLGRVTLTFV